MAESKKKTEELAVAQTQELEMDLSMFNEFKAVDGIIQGMEAVTTADIKMPRYKLLQSNSAEVAKGLGTAGQFFNTVTNEVKDELVVALLCMNKSRVRFERPYKRGASPICRSFDGKASQDGEACSMCDYCNWDKAKADGLDSPECRESITWLFLEENDLNGIPPRIIVSGASRAEHANFITKISAQGFAPYIFKVRITSEQQTNDKGIFYVLKFNFVTDPENPKKILTFPVDTCRTFAAKSKQWSEMTSKFAEHDTVNATDVIDEGDSEGAVF